MENTNKCFKCNSNNATGKVLDGKHRGKPLCELCIKNAIDRAEKRREKRHHAYLRKPILNGMRNLTVEIEKNTVKEAIRQHMAVINHKYAYPDKWELVTAHTTYSQFKAYMNQKYKGEWIYLHEDNFKKADNDKTAKHAEELYNMDDMPF